MKAEGTTQRKPVVPAVNQRADTPPSAKAISKRVALNAEYYYVPEGQIATPYVNCLSIGFDIETGGHVFQLHFTNSADMTYKGFITETQEDWFFKDGDGKMLSGIRFGFNISRVFTLVKPKKLG